MRSMKGLLACILVVAIPLLSGCSAEVKDQEAQEAPPRATVVSGEDVALFSVERPEQYAVVAASERDVPPQMVVTGTVVPDIARTIPVVTLASGRVLEVRARLGDTVKKGQVLLRIRSDDVAGGFSDHRKAVADELLARKQLDRAKLLHDHGAIAMSDLEVAQDAEDDAKVTLDTTAEHLRLLGNDPDRPAGIVDIVAPISGVITDQEVTNASIVQSYSANPFTIADLSSVWIVCDVYENDLPEVRVGETADIRLNAYPERILKGTISNIGSILDPSIRTAKVRIEVRNPGFMHPGMFVTATFRGKTSEAHSAVPASAILHIHDREFVYIPASQKQFRRVEVISGEALAGNLQEVISGIRPGQEVVSNALVLDRMIEQ